MIAVIYGIAWIMKHAKKSKTRPTGHGLAQIASLPLGAGRSVALVRVGREVLVVGVAENGVTPIRSYSEAEAIALGIEVPPEKPDELRPGREAFGPGARRPAADHGSLVKIDSSNAVQILLLIGGLSILPAILFTVTGFTRILIVLGFIRTALGTQTTPPNQVLIGIALFLTLFVMAPTITAIKKDAWDPLLAARDLDLAGDHPRRAAAARVHVQADADAGPVAVREPGAHPRRSRRRGPRSRPTC